MQQVLMLRNYVIAWSCIKKTNAYIQITFTIISKIKIVSKKVIVYIFYKKYFSQKQYIFINNFMHKNLKRITKKNQFT